MRSRAETPVVIETDRFVIEGKSRAGNETYFRIRDLGISLDIGRCPDLLVGVQHIFVTHAHLDHALGIPFYAHQRKLRQLSPGTVYIPIETADDYGTLMRLHEKLENTHYPLNLVGLGETDRVALRRDLEVVTHRSTHRVPTNAYEFHDERTPILFYTGDTDRRILERGGAIFRAEVLMIECSFTGPGDEDRAARYAHIHLNDIYEFADRFENRLIVLTHFSLRESPAEIHLRIAQTCPETLRPRLRLALPDPFNKL